MKGGGAPFDAALRAAKRARNALSSKARSKKTVPAKTAKRFLAAPFHKAPPGRQKSEREFCLFGGIFLRPMCRAMWRAGRSCAACRCCGGFCDRCSGVFSASVSLPCSQPAGWPPFFVWPALPPPGGCVRDFPLVHPRSVALFPARVPRLLPVLCGFLRPLPFCPPCAFLHTFLPCFGCLFACSVLCAPGFSLLFFRPFLTDFCLSNFFSFVAQAATGLYFLPKRK